MLKIANNAAWEMSKRESLIEPKVYADADTIYLPVNIVEISMPISIYDDDGEVIEVRESPGYAFDEYRINSAIGLPEEAATALAAALQDNIAENADMKNALATLGVM